MLFPKIILKKAHFLSYPLFLFILVFQFIFILCVNAPETPYQAKNARIYLVMESSDKKIDDFTLVDTAGKTFRIGVRSNLLLYIDSIRVSIFSKTTDLIEKDTFLQQDENADTQWCSFILNTEGARSVIARAFIQGGGICSDSANLSIFARLNPSNPDTMKPILALFSPASDSARISSNACQIKIRCVDASGISLVKCSMGNDSFAVLKVDSLYSAAIIGLKAGYVNIIVFVATDASPKANKDSLIVHIIYDSTMQDNEPPILSYVDGPKDRERVMIPIDTIVYTIADHSGVDSVFWTLDGILAGTIKKQANDNYKLPFELLNFGINRLVIHAQDGSINKNMDSIAITLIYNTKPGAIAQTVPADKVVGVDTLPTFTWTGGDDADGDTVYCKVLFGTSANELSLKTSEVIGKTVTIPIAEKLKVYTKYYWRVIAYSKIYPDTSKSSLDSFTTMSASLSITRSPLSVTINEGDTLNLSVTANGTPAPNHFQWYHNDAAITGATSATYKKADARAVDAGEYNVVVSNEAGDSAISETAVVTVVSKCTVTYFGNGNIIGNVPASTTHFTGSRITVAGNTGGLTKTGYSFIGWNTDSLGNGIDYAAGSPLIIQNTHINLYARWVINQYTVIFDPQGGGAVAAQTIKHGDTVANPAAPAKRSYTFAGWFKESGCTNSWNFTNDKITSPDTMFAKWVIMDADSNIYTEVTIGTQVWMVENLKTTKYNNGTPIDDCGWYNSDISNKEKYGALYSWAVVDPANFKKIAPTGWHVPSAAEWTTLQNYLIANGYNYDNTTAGNKIGKALASTTDWDHSDVVGTVGNSEGTNNRSLFSGMPGGSFYNYTHQNFYGLGQNAAWWSSSNAAVSPDMEKISCSLRYDSDALTIGEMPTFYNLSIRLIKD